MEKKKKFNWKEWLISLLITLVMLGAVMGAEYWYTSTTGMALDASAVWIGNLIGGLLMLFIVHHFVKSPKSDDPYRY